MANSAEYRRLSLVISGGQTGADRGGLEAAIVLGIPHGGWCPAGRRAEDGHIQDRYRLIEHSSSSYRPRTKSNIASADATIVFIQDEQYVTTGSLFTIREAACQLKPGLVVAAF